MSSYLSSFLTTTTSRYASIKQTLLASEADGDTEDDTNVCRTLRSYYTEKGRPFPGWLPPDPKAPPPAAIQPVYASNNVGAGYGNLQAPDSSSRPGSGSSRLNSLWDTGRGGQAADNNSLRAPTSRPGAMARGQSNPQERRSPFDRNQTSSDPPMARPLPSQRAGSYQTAGRDNPAPSQPLNAQDRLKARFGQKSTPRMSDTSRQGSANNYGSGEGGGSYEDSFAPGNYNTGGSSGSRGTERPFVAATSPWASNEKEFGGGRGGYNAPAPERRGLPSGPKRGLPSGPRSMR